MREILCLLVALLNKIDVQVWTGVAQKRNEKHGNANYGDGDFHSESKR